VVDAKDKAAGSFPSQEEATNSKVVHLIRSHPRLPLPEVRS